MLRELRVSHALTSRLFWEEFALHTNHSQDQKFVISKISRCPHKLYALKIKCIDNVFPFLLRQVVSNYFESLAKQHDRSCGSKEFFTSSLALGPAGV